MKRIPIPIESVRKLQEHPYVEKATGWSVRFTPEFKRIAYEAYRNGKSMRQIFKEAGIDVEILGGKRLQNFRNHLVEESKGNPDFENQRKSSRKEQSTESQMAKRIRELEHRNAYLEQENEFLKKIHSTEKG